MMHCNSRSVLIYIIFFSFHCIILNIIGLLLPAELRKIVRYIIQLTKLNYQLQKRNGRLDSEIVMEMCTDMIKILPQQVLPNFTKGRHLKLPEALEKLKTKLGIKKTRKQPFTYPL